MSAPVTKLALDIGVSFDLGPDDRMIWISDMGWVVGALTAVSTSFVGGSLLLVEGTPDYPDTTRHWRVMQENDVTFLGIAPTTVRGMMRYGDEVDAFDFSKRGLSRPLVNRGRMPPGYGYSKTGVGKAGSDIELHWWDGMLRGHCVEQFVGADYTGLLQRTHAGERS